MVVKLSANTLSWSQEFQSGGMDLKDMIEECYNLRLDGVSPAQQHIAEPDSECPRACRRLRAVVVPATRATRVVCKPHGEPGTVYRHALVLLSIMDSEHCIGLCGLRVCVVGAFLRHVWSLSLR